MPKPKLAKADRIKYELILAWASSRVPFCSQKMAFYAPAKFSLAYKEAVHIRDILQRAGGFKKSEVKLLAVGVVDVMQLYMKENQPYLLKRQEDLHKQVKRFLKSDAGKQSAEDKKPIKTAFKAAKKFKSGKSDTLQISINKSKKPSPTMPPVKVLPKPVPMIDARKKVTKK